jgi:hypothetical protein
VVEDYVIPQVSTRPEVHFWYGLRVFYVRITTIPVPIWGDRVVSAAAAVAFVLQAAKMAHLTRPAMLAVAVAESLMWTVAAMACLILLVRGFKTSHTKH